MKKKSKIVLTFSAQQYGLTVEDLIKRNPDISEADIIVSKSELEDSELLKQVFNPT